MHQSIPAAPSPPPPRADPRALAVFLRWMADSHWREKRGQIPCPQSTLQHFSLIAQSNSAVLKHFNVHFFVSSNVFLCNSARILIKTSRCENLYTSLVILSPSHFC